MEFGEAEKLNEILAVVALERTKWKLLSRLCGLKQVEVIVKEE